jgi:hypothetical protein
MALEIFRLVGSVFVDTDKADKSLKKTDKNAEGFGKKLQNVGKAAGTFAMGVVGAVGAAGTAVVALTETTREYRTEQGKLQTAFQTQNFTAEEARRTYEALNGVLGDSGQAVEAANHLAQLATNEKDLATWTDICTGVYATFGDSLPIEGLTEAANETAKTGALTGGLTDALNWAGVSEEEFQAKLDACNTEQERAALITSTMNGLYSEASDKYKELNADVIAANEAQDKLNNAMATVGAAMEPFVTKGKELIAEVLEKLTPALEWLGTTALPWVSNGVSAVVKWFTDLIGKFGESGLTFDQVMTTIKTVFDATVKVLKGIWDTIGKPLWDLIKQNVGLVAGYFQEKMPEIQAFVSTCFKDIQSLWKNNLQPALKAIGDFIQNVLAPAFKWVFDKIITPVVDNAFKGIKQLWTGTLKPVFQGILDFVTGVFTLDFKKAFEGLVKAVGGIWEGLKTVVKTPINAVIDIVNGFIKGLNGIKIPDWVPVVGGSNLSIPTIPKLAAGGVLERGQVGLLEGNGAEAVVPLHNNRKWISAVAQDMDRAIGGGSDQVVALLLDIVALLEQLTNAGIYLDTGALVGGLAKPMDKRLGQIQAAKART